jgi:hypothetical protein
MKNMCVQLCLVAALLTAVAIPLVGHGRKSSGAANAGAAVATPRQVANAGPWPPPKKPSFVLS